MSKRFVCRFAVGQDNLAYSGIWRVWTARNQPDLYLAVETISGEMKATVHCPRPPHSSWERHYSFPKEASGPVAEAAKKDGGPHRLRWTGCAVAPDCTLEYRVIFRGKSLEQSGTTVRADTALLPIPTEQEYVEVAVLLGPAAETVGYPREKDTPTHLLSEGRLSNGRRVWIVYCMKLIALEKNKPPQQHSLDTAKSYMDPTVDLSNTPMRGALIGRPEPDDGSLLFWDVSAKYTAMRSLTSTQIFGLVFALLLVTALVLLAISY